MATKKKPLTIAERVRRIELDVNRHAVASHTRTREVYDLVAVIAAQLGRIEPKVDKAEREISLIRSGATFMQELDKAESQPEGLQPGDYTSGDEKMSLKEVADALTAMGFKWGPEKGDEDRHHITVQVNNIFHLPNGPWRGTHLDPATFLRRAAVTAKALGLVPVEPWVPKVGDAVRYKDDTGITKMGHGVVTQLHKGAMTGRISASVNFESTHNDFWIEDLRPATDAEIAAHLAEQEARKPIIPYVTRVTWRNGYEWIVIDSADAEGNYALHRHGGMMHLVPRNQFTVIEQP